jgi:DNA-binding response OmpR family regulator
MNGQKPRLLIIDDDDELRQSAADGLADAGYDPIVAVDGRQALDLLHGHGHGTAHGERPRLILLDLMMPVMNGWEFRDALRNEMDLARVPILVMTASRSLAAHPLQADSVLLKPFGLGQLLGRVNELVDRR